MSLFKKIYGGSYSVSKTALLTSLEARVKSAMVVAGEFGLQAKCDLGDGKLGYLPLSKNSQLKDGDELPLATAKVITLSKEGGDDIIRVIES